MIIFTYLSCYSEWNIDKNKCNDELQDTNGNKYITKELNGFCITIMNYIYGKEIKKFIDFISTNTATEVIKKNLLGEESGYYTTSEIFGIDPAAFNPQGICPNGWHIPSIHEWNSMISFYSEDYAKLYSDLNIKPTMFYKSDGDSLQKINAAYFASSSRSNTSSIFFYLYIPLNFEKPSIDSISDQYAICVRCLKD